MRTLLLLAALATPLALGACVDVHNPPPQQPQSTVVVPPPPPGGTTTTVICPAGQTC